ncbi:MAG: XTP/dITP diphosphatase [Peptococcaceae bacterium]|nr:XTP/dITP diphosphatase [Peptococcaceae bacterium]
MQTVIIASGNKGKLKEFRELMAELPVEVKSLADYPEIGDIEENGTTFAENAYIKAKAVHDATGCLCIADDSGLEVDALDGAPGIYSARYAGAEKDDAANNAKLLAALENVPEDKRGAQFHCAIVAIAADGRRFDAEGIVRGQILRAPRGENGFGYDPLFYIPEFARTTAELTMDEKNAISHRGKAVRKIVEVLKEQVFHT